MCSLPSNTIRSALAMAATYAVANLVADLAYAWLDVAGRPSLVVGGLAPGGDLAVYFVRDVSDIDAAVGQLRVALLIGSIVLVIAALVAARRLARGILSPIEEAGRTAERIERGDLLARVPVTSHDEFGTWADRFNRMTDTLAESIRRLEAAQHQNRRFVADVSHELRTPVTALVAEASIVGEHLGELPPESRRAAELLVNDVGRLRDLVEELMELSRFDADAEEVSLEKVDLARLIETVRAARSPRACTARRRWLSSRPRLVSTCRSRPRSTASSTRPLISRSACAPCWRARSVRRVEWPTGWSKANRRPGPGTCR